MVSNQTYDVPFNWRETKCGPKITNENVEIVEIVNIFLGIILITIWHGQIILL